MSMENGPRPEIAKVETGNDIEKEIAVQESQLEGNTKDFIEKFETKMAELKAKEDAGELAPAQPLEMPDFWKETEKSVDELCRDIDLKLKDRLENWSLTMAGIGATAGGLLLGNPGGMEGVGLGLLHGVETGVAAATVATAIWAVNHLAVGIKRWKEGKESK